MKVVKWGQMEAEEILKIDPKARKERIDKFEFREHIKLITESDPIIAAQIAVYMESFIVTSILEEFISIQRSKSKITKIKRLFKELVRINPRFALEILNWSSWEALIPFLLKCMNHEQRATVFQTNLEKSWVLLLQMYTYQKESKPLVVPTMELMIKQNRAQCFKFFKMIPNRAEFIGFILGELARRKRKIQTIDAMTQAMFL